jgi:large repetitive protein
MSSRDITRRRLLTGVLAVLAALGVLVTVGSVSYANTTPQALPLSQDWSDTDLITTNDDWSRVPGIIGYRGDKLAAEGTDPQTVTADGSGTPVDVTANKTNPSAHNNGGVMEFHGSKQAPPKYNTNPAVALQGNVTADAPHLVLNVNTTDQNRVRVSYTLRDIDGGPNDATQPVALQYRVGDSGDYTNLPGGYVSDATTGPKLAVSNTPVSAVLPADANNKPLVQVRIITVNTPTQDEWVGIDDISVINPNPAIDLNGSGVGSGYSATFTEDDGPKLIVDGSALTVTSMDAGVEGRCDDEDRCDDEEDIKLVSATVKIANLQDGDAESLDADTSGTAIAKTYDPSTGELRLTGVASKENYQKVLRTVTYHNASQNPSTADRSVTFVVSDGTGDSNTATSTVTVNPVNDEPKATDDSYNVDEDGQLTIDAPGILSNDSDFEGDSLTVKPVVSGPAHGQLNLNADGSFTYTPAADFNGEDFFTYKATDGALDSGAAKVAITVEAVNDAPVARDLAGEGGRVTTPEDTPKDITLEASDVDSTNLTFSVVDGPANGTLSGSGANLTYTPNRDFNGTDSFTYRVCDDSKPEPLCDEGRIDIHVTPVNDAPVANDDSYSTEEDTTLRVPEPGVLENDTDADGDTLTVRLVDGPSNGVLDLSPDGSFTYTASANFNGTDAFTYEACDAQGECVTATVEIPVGAANDTPTAGDDLATTNEELPIRIDVLANDEDPEGREELDPSSVVVTMNPARGTTAVNPDGSITYNPSAGFTGVDAFTYRVCDTGTPRECDTARVNVTVNPVNDAPVVRDDRGSTGVAASMRNSYISQYTSSTASTPTRLYRPNTTRLPYTLTKIGADIAGPMNAIGYRSTERSLYGYRVMGSPGIMKVNPNTGAARFLGNPRGLSTSNVYYAGDVSPDGSTYYLYAANSRVLWRVDLTTFRASSVNLSSVINLPDFAVSPTDGNLYGVAKDGRLLRVDPRTGQVTATNVAGLKPGGYGAAWFTAEGDLIAYENGSSLALGAITWIARPATAPSVVSSQAAPSVHGNDGAAYVAPPNPAGLSVVVDVLANDGDSDGALNPNTLRIVQPPANGSARINADKTITYTSGSSYRGTDSFRYGVCDSGAPRQCSTATVNITSEPIASSTSLAASRRE